MHKLHILENKQICPVSVSNTEWEPNTHSREWAGDGASADVRSMTSPLQSPYFIILKTKFSLVVYVIFLLNLNPVENSLKLIFLQNCY